MSSKPVVPLLIVAALAAAGDAPAAEVRVTVPCVVTSAEQAPVVPIEGSGFTPNSTADVLTNGFEANLEPVPIAADGRMSHTLYTPVGRFSHETPAELRVTDEGGVSAATSFLMVYRSLLLPRRAIAGRPVRHQAVGYPVGRTVWLFYEHRRRIRFMSTLGETQAPCGVTAPSRQPLLGRGRRDGVWRIGVATSLNVGEVHDIYRVRKRGNLLTNLGEER